MIRSEPVRVAQLAAGFLLLLVAPVLATIPQPIPIGIIVFGFGLALILRNSLWARRKYVRWQHRYPRAGRITDIGLRRRRKPVARRAPVVPHTEAPVAPREVQPAGSRD
ncbi:MAG: hypothetical protein ACRCUI_13125 [Polymorphobacter sp.]